MLLNRFFIMRLVAFIVLPFQRRLKRVDHSAAAALFALFIFFSPALLSAGSTVDRTLDIFSRVEGVTPDQVEASRERIGRLDYSSLKVFRLICALENMTGYRAEKVLSSLEGEPLSYDHFQLFERFISLDGMSLDLGLEGLEVIRRLDYTSIWAASSLCAIPSVTSAQVIAAIGRLSELAGAGRWAAKAFFEIRGQSGELALQGLEGIRQLSEEQCWVAESCSKIQAISVDQVLESMFLISRIRETDVRVVRSLFQVSGLTPAEALYWLESYFSLSASEQDILYQSLSPARKTRFLNAFHEASEHIIRRLNALHSISSRNGEEISVAELRAFSFAELTNLFAGLPQKIRLEFGPGFAELVEKKDRENVIRRLRLATEKARIHLAAQCCSANIYVLLSRVTILYDSSFRLVLIPELQKRLASEYRGSLLSYLRSVDPENVYVGQFIAALAHKGRLAMFFPADTSGQKEILDLVAGSAFRDENSLIFFAAAFSGFGKVVQPAAFQFLLDKMITMAGDDNLIFARQIRVILQYYLENDPGLLGGSNLKRIREVLNTHGEVALEFYGETPFAQWREDGQLSGLSIFHGDDDGRLSFLANCRYLSASGYAPRPGRLFAGDQDNAASNNEMRGLLAAAAAGDISSLNDLFVLLRKKGLVVDYVKTVNSVEICHSISVFRDSRTQLRLMAEFLDHGHEMLIHRGHSYWLEDHLLAPLRQLMESGAMSRSTLGAKQRFLSIGACGGIMIYAELVNIFCNRVDLLGSLGSGRTMINNMYNRFLFEAVAVEQKKTSWREMDRKLAFIFQGEGGGDYLLPGGLPALLYKITGKGQCRFIF